MRLLPALTLPLVASAMVSASLAQHLPPGGYMTAPFGPGGTWNLYQTSMAPLTWTAAQELAEKTNDSRGGTGKAGHLVAIGSAAENMFVYQYVLGSYIWIGLTDNERWGGKEAGADRGGGWRWVNGEPVTWSAWRSPEPNDRDAGGEDGVAIERSGRWADWGIGSAGQSVHRHPFVIEWDTQLPQPVPGVLQIGRVLPAKWPADLLAWDGEAKGSGAWNIFGAINLNGAHIRSVTSALSAALAGDVRHYRLPRLNYRWPGRPERAGGWMDITDRPVHPCIEGGCGALHVAKIHVEKKGTWSFNVHGDDFFALRLPGLKWKSASGLGGIDPLDAETLYFDTVSGDGGVIGVIDLPAGDHVIEIVSGNRLFEVMLQLMAAPGEFAEEGATDRWRFPGHKAAGDLAWPGIDDAGWTVSRTDQQPGGPPLAKLEDALALADSGKGVVPEKFAAVNFIDSGAAGDIEFPKPVSFPGDKPGNQEKYVVKAAGKLVIPRDGLYHIGIHAEDHCALRIADRKWLRIVRDTGYLAKIEGDTLYEEDTDFSGTNAQIVGEIALEKGTYEIEALYAEINGTSVLSVFGGPAGFPPRLLTKDGAKIEPDIDGLELR
jgi:hypothetical protein